MYERYSWRRLGDCLERKCRHAAAVAAHGGQTYVSGGEIGRVDGAFLAAAGEDGDNTAEGGGGLKKGEEADDEADAGVVGYGEGVGEAFRCVFYVLAM